MANRDHCFQGPIPVGKGFVISSAEATKLLTNDVNHDVVRPYLDSDDINDSTAQSPGRWVIDFGSKTLEAADAYSEALTIVRRDVKPERDENADSGFRTKWWQFGRPRGPMRTALAPLSRYVAVGRHGKRMGLAWVGPWAMASDATSVFAFDDDYSMGLLPSRAHDAWAWAQSSTLETRLRYTPTTVFETFP